MNEKKPFLFVDDYGMGGIWIRVRASDPSSVMAQYPALQHVATPPAWLKKETELREVDIDTMPKDLEYLKEKKG